MIHQLKAHTAQVRKPLSELRAELRVEAAAALQPSSFKTTHRSRTEILPQDDDESPVASSGCCA